MKKSFKRAGVAVLSMAMLLSMGAIGATSVSAAGESITVATSTGLATTDKVNVYKVATSSATGWAWETDYDGVTGITDFKNLNASNAEEVANKLARVAITKTPTTNGNVGTAVDLSSFGKGYYLVIAAPKDAGKVAQPMLIEVKDGTAANITTAKVSQIDLTKVITEVDTKDDAALTNHVAADGKSAQAAAGEKVKYRIVARIPSYDTNVAATDIQDFVLTDTSEDTLTSVASSFNMYIANTKEATTGDAVNASALNRNSNGHSFTVTLGGSTVKANPAKYLIVEFTAVVGDNPVISKGLGVREDQKDEAGKSADANKNDVVLTYGNNYSTGGGSDTDGDGDVDNDDEQPELKDYADVYATALYINKTLGTTAVAAGKDEVGFTLYDAAGTTVVREEVKTDNTGKVSFVGLDAGTYTLKETKTKDGYKKVDDFKVTISSSTPYATFTAKTGETDWDTVTAGGLEMTINNPDIESLPGTGGMGTVLFTVGGAAVVLLAGAMFVVYMRKRKVEE